MSDNQNPTRAERLAQYRNQLVEQGFSPAEAFTLVRDGEAATYGVTAIAYPSPDPSAVPVTDEERNRFMREREQLSAENQVWQRVVEALKAAVVPAYLTEDDVEHLITRAVKEK
jgi:hypothetical protein